MPQGSSPAWVLAAIVGLIVGGALGWMLSPTTEPELPETIQQLPPDVFEDYEQQFGVLELRTSGCQWPCYCKQGPPPGLTAIEMLGQIFDFVVDEQIDPVVKDSIIGHIRRACDPNLKGSNGKPVCDLQIPEACKELHDDVWQKAKAANGSNDDGLWLDVETEIGAFPSGR